MVTSVSARRAEAVTLEEIVELTRAGLSDDVLLALIEIDQRVFAIDPATLSGLKKAGVSDRVIIAIVKSGRTPPPPPPPAPVAVTPPDPPEPQVIVIEREPPIVREVVVPVPVYVAVGTRSHVRRPHVSSHLSDPIYNAPISFPPTFSGPRSPDDSRHAKPDKKAEPVYWGWGGKRRPDSWQPK
jgi:hypothetical protein